MDDNIIEVDFQQGKRKDNKSDDTDQDPPGGGDPYKDFKHLVESYGLVQVMFHPFVGGVEVPQYLKEQDIVRLNFGYWNSAPDFKYDEESVRSSLLFNGNPYYCVIPWKAVFALIPVEK